AWMIFVPLWTTCAYSVNAMLLWGGGYWAQHGALDYSGGYVIHLAAGTSGFVAAAVIGPRLKRDRDTFTPNNLLLVAAGAGILWLGWNGFNGGDPYFASADASAAVLNTNLATGAALLTWVFADMFGGAKKANFLGAINGMIVGLVAITPAAGFVNGWGALLIGIITSLVVWFSWNHASKMAVFRRVDDALGVVHTHGVAGLMGGLLVGVFADPKMIEYPVLGPHGKLEAATGAGGLFYGNGHQLLVQGGAALTVILWDAFVTFVLLKFIHKVLRVQLRFSLEELEIGDAAIHLEEIIPPESARRLGQAAYTPHASSAEGSLA
ncbi:MAG: ammonium transporter, partial [Acidimicrobiales bacterium]